MTDRAEHMTKGRTPGWAWQLGGIIALGGAARSSEAHRVVYEAFRHGPASVWEMVFGLVSFAAASLGMLLLLHGRALFRIHVGDGRPRANPGPVTCSTRLKAAILRRQ